MRLTQIAAFSVASSLILATPVLAERGVSRTSERVEPQASGAVQSPSKNAEDAL